MQKLNHSSGVMDDEAVHLLEEGIKEGFLTLDAKLRERHELENDDEHSGTTAICAIVTPTHIVLANLGLFELLVTDNVAGNHSLMPMKFNVWMKYKEETKADED